jgi:glycosyltransferase involved in cell wall biosynthesis
MKILYIACHDVLEYDEIKIFSKLGHEIVSIGSFIVPDKLNSSEVLRPPINNLNVNKDLVEEFFKINPTFNRSSNAHNNFKLTQEFINKFDCIITCYNFNELRDVYTHGSKPRLIIRSPGQFSTDYESNVRYYRQFGCKVVRFSPIEARCSPLLSDAVIRLPVDMNLYSGWIGNDPYILTFSQYMPNRVRHVNLLNYLKVVSGLPSKLYGFGNSSLTCALGGLTSSEQIERLKEARVYFSTGTIPGPYSYSFVEAFSMGIPIVTWGKNIGGVDLMSGINSFEVPDLLENGKEGYCSDDMQELKSVIHELLTNYKLASTISKNARDKCRKIFSEELCKQGWENIFKTL